MRGMVFVVLATLGCGKHEENAAWNPHKITAVDVGGVHFEIPKGWRDASESADPEWTRVAERDAPNMQAHVIVRERDPDIDISFTILQAALEEPQDARSCAQIMLDLPSRAIMTRALDITTLRERTFGTDKGCSALTVIDRTAGQIYVRVHDGKLLALQCLRRAADDPGADAGCTALSTALGLSN